MVDGTHRYAGIKMPVNYVAEMLCDRIAASKTYLKDQYTDAAAYDYYMHARDVYLYPQRDARPAGELAAHAARRRGRKNLCIRAAVSEGAQK